ncbi:hypothetical protein ACUNWD_05215 [Sunxiuqinia sp. A32]|uniref:hypothetical protein n=1 Tax=Sunxiuqinia sp. A32 TaxID=3461496 RepID=UPI0040458C2C
MNNRFIFYIVIIFSFTSCLKKNVRERIRVENYAIGDTIDPKDFFYKNKMDSAVLVGECISKPDLDVFTWFDTIVLIVNSVKTKTEFDSLSNQNTLILNQKPVVETEESNGKFKRLLFKWNDKKTGDRILMEHITDSIGNFKGSIIIENDRFVKELIPNQGETVIDIAPEK